MTLDDRLRKAVDTLRMVTEELSAESRPQPHASRRLLDAIRTIDEARSLTAVLDALVARAAGEASRAGVLLVRAGRVRAWRDDDQLDLPLAETGFVADAVRAGFPASTTAASVALPPFANASVGAELHAFPLALSGVVVAVLYAEGGDAGSLEILARHAARALEALTAFKTARAIAGASSVAAPPAAKTPPNADEEMAAARRYARLLIAEIKLYHQEAVEAGRREGDLSARLGGEIARARSLYGERVPAHVRHVSDYFRDELVETLAGGDASLVMDVSAA
jgi:hypothetical protein